MKRITGMLVCLALLFSNSVFAQNIQITGTVTSEEDGSVLPGVSVVIQGTTSGTTTNIDGVYSLSAPSDAILVFSFVGMITAEEEVNGRTQIDVVMTSEMVEMEEVVVTALGIPRETRRLGYAIQEVGEEDIIATSESNLANQLTGKIAGVQVTSSSGNMTGSARVLIRGAKSFTGENNPLYVIDGIQIDNTNFNVADGPRSLAAREEMRGGGGYDYGNMAMDINPSDIQSITVLKGAAATALYGSRAANGALIITTKSGSRGGKKGIGVSINSGVTFEQVAVLPDYQNEYGGGYYDYFDVDTISGTPYNIPYYGADESWGPRMEGQPVAAWNNVYDYEQGITEGLETSPWNPHPDNIKDFFETGVAYTNNVALFGGDENSNFRLSYTNLNRTGIFPNSSVKKNTISLSGEHKFGERIKASARVNYMNYYAKAIPANGYGDNSIMQKFAQWGQRSWDMDEMSNYKNPDGTQRSWNRSSFSDPAPAYSDNPYWTQYENFNENWRDRVIGMAKLQYNLTDWLSLSGSINGDIYTDRRTERVSVSSAATSYYEEGIRTVNEINTDAFLNFYKDVTADINITGFVGVNFRDYIYRMNTSNTNGGLGVPGFYSLENSSSAISTTDYESHKRVNSVLGSVTTSYKDLLSLDLTLRNDWSSTLPENEGSYLYPSAALSFVFTELDPLQSLTFMDFGKIRLSWAQVGNDTEPYQLYNTYVPLDNFGNLPRYSVPAKIPNSNLKPENTKAFEIGTNLQFFDNRFGVDFTYYSMNTVDHLMEVSVSGATGYTAYMVNAGEMSNKGVELMLNLVPVRTSNFSWDIDLNWAKNTNEVVSLAEGIDVLNLTSLWGVYISAKPGEPYGVLRATNYVYDDQGRIVINEDGSYLTSPELEVLGSVLPDWTGGLRNTFTFKGISASALIDMRKGGYLFSTTHMFGTWTGLFEETVGNNDKGNPLRDPVDEGGGVRLEGVVGHFDDNGELVIDSEENTTYIDPYVWSSDHYFGPRAQNVFKTDYIKLREVSVGYSLPKSVLAKLPLSTVKISFVGRNLALWGTNVPHIDPEQATNSGNIQGLEGGANPSTRTFGFDLLLEF